MFFNNEQQIAFQKIKQFLNSKQKIFVLNGAAGTGKTTVISKIFKSQEYNKKKIVLAATTNKAVSVIEQMFNIYHENIDFHTIHKICNIKRSIDHEGNQLYNYDENPVYSKNKKSIYNYDIIVIDEASMINLNMLKYINSIKYKIRGKIIMVGDKYQLPPVNETKSNAFNFEYYDDTYCLNKIMRYDSNILEFSIRIRDCIDTKKQISIKNICDSSFEICKKSDLWKEEYLKEFSYNNIFLAYTNKKCEEINNYIRKKYFKNEKLLEYIVDELIVFNNYYNSIIESNISTSSSISSTESVSNISTSSSISSTESVSNISISPSKSESEPIKFYTSNSARIIQCDIKSYTIPNFPLESLFNLKQEMTPSFKIIKKKKILNGEEPCPICFEPIKNIDNIIETDCKHIFCESCIRLWLEEHKLCPYCRMNITNNKLIINNDTILTSKINDLFENLNNNTINIWKLKVKSNYGEGYVYIIKKENKQSFENLKSNIKKSIIELKNYIYKTMNKSDNRFILKRIWEYYYINYIDIFGDISYGYCITVHKSQGSTYKNVYIDAKNILEYNRKDYINYKCLYTAITRASNKVFMLV